MSDGKRQRPLVNPIRTSLVDSGWEDAPARLPAPPPTPTGSTVNMSRRSADSITEEVDELLEEIGAGEVLDVRHPAPAGLPLPAFGAAARELPKAKTRVRTKTMLGVAPPATSVRGSGSAGDDDLFERALGGELAQQSKPPPRAIGDAHTQLRNAGLPRFDSSSSESLPRFASDDSQPVYVAPQSARGPRAPSTPPPPPAASRAPSMRPPPPSTSPVRVATVTPPSTPPPRVASVPPPAVALPASPPISSARGPSALPELLLGTAAPDSVRVPSSRSMPEPPSASSQADRSPRRGVSGWAVAIWVVLALGAGGAAGFLGFRAQAARAVEAAPKTPNAAAKPTEPAASVSRVAARPAAPISEVEEATDPSLLGRAAAGDEGALAEIERKPDVQRSADEAVALAQGRAVARRRAARELREKIARDPKLAEDAETLKLLREQAQDPDAAREALRAMAAIPSPSSTDLLYEVWTKNPKRTATTELAEALLFSKDVRSKASPALAVALDLRRAETCEANQALLGRAEKHGDRRSLAPLMKLTAKRGCGPKKANDCFACLGKREQVRDAVKAALGRKEPKL